MTIATVKVRNDNKWGLLSDGIVTAFERKKSISLPVDYREFLIAHHGGVPEPNFYWVVPNDWGSGIENLYGFGTPGYTLDEYFSGRSRIGVPIELLPIGDDGCCNYLCIDIGNQSRNKIFYVDHEFATDDPRKVRELAASFSRFLAKLSPDPDE